MKKMDILKKIYEKSVEAKGIPIYVTPMSRELVVGVLETIGYRVVEVVDATEQPGRKNKELPPMVLFFSKNSELEPLGLDTSVLPDVDDDGKEHRLAAVYLPDDIPTALVTAGWKMKKSSHVLLFTQPVVIDG